MHRHIEEWNERIKARGLSSESFVHRIDEKMFTKDDRKYFDTD